MIVPRREPGRLDADVAALLSAAPRLAFARRPDAPLRDARPLLAIRRLGVCVWGCALLLLIDASCLDGTSRLRCWGARLQDLAYRGVVVTHSAVALAIFFALWALHARIKPSFKTASSPVFSRATSSPSSRPRVHGSFVFETERTLWIEALLLTVLGMSYLATASYLGLVYYRETHGDAPKEADTVELRTDAAFLLPARRSCRPAGSQLSFDNTRKGPSPQQLCSRPVRSCSPRPVSATERLRPRPG